MTRIYAILAAIWLLAFSWAAPAQVTLGGGAGTSTQVLCGNGTPNGGTWCTPPNNDPNTLNACAYSGIDNTGTTDSRTALISAMTAAVTAGQTLWINCPIKLTYGTDYTKAIFPASGTNLTFGPNGVFIVDNMLTAAFIFEWVHDCTWINTQIKYVGTPGITAINYATAGNGTIGLSQNGTTITNYLIAHNGNTFSGGASAIWEGTTNAAALIQIRGGANRINLIGANSRVYVPDGVSAANYVPVVFDVGPDWNAGVAVTSGLSSTTSNSSIPTNINIDGWTLDGYYMGIVGSSNSTTFSHITAVRYSDIQDGTSGTVTFSAGLSSGATTGTLSASTYPSGWPNPTGIYWLTFSNAQTLGALLTQGQTTVGSFLTTTGSSGSLSSSATATATSGNQGGLSLWLAPPHLIYVDEPVYTVSWDIHNILDLGVYSGLAARRTGGSLHSIKFAVENYSSIDWYVSLRPDGAAQFVSTGFGNGNVSHFYGVSNTGLLNTASAGVGQTVIFPGGSAPYINLTINDMTVVDTAAVPLSFPMSGIGQTGSNHISITNLKVFAQDWPSTYFPGFGWLGSDYNVQAEVHLANCTSTQISRGVVANQGSETVTDSYFDYKIFGWRALTASNYSSMKQRILGLGQLGAGTNNYARVYDVQNSWEGIYSNGSIVENWTQMWAGTPTGSSQATTIQFPTTMSIDRDTWQVTTNLDTTNTVASVNVGDSGNNTRYFSAQGITAGTNPIIPLASIAQIGSVVTLYPVGGTFGTTGKAIVALRGSQQLGGN